MCLFRYQTGRLNNRRAQNTDDGAAQISLDYRYGVSDCIQSLSQHHQKYHPAHNPARQAPVYMQTITNARIPRI